jgi:hypothetical protein
MICSDFASIEGTCLKQKDIDANLRQLRLIDLCKQKPSHGSSELKPE